MIDFDPGETGRKDGEASRIESIEGAAGPVRLVRAVRAAGLTVSTAETLDLVRAIEVVGFLPPQNLRSAARCVLARSPDHYPVIDRAVDGYMRELAGAETPADVNDHISLPEDRPPPADGADEGKTAESTPRLPAGAAEDSSGGRPGLDDSANADLSESGGPRYSPVAAPRRKDFGSYSAEEAEAAKRFIRTMVWRPPTRRSRRRRPSAHGADLDMRRLCRQSLRSGGEITQLRYLRREPKPRPLVVLCDVSGSMDAHSRMLLHFLHSLRRCYSRAEVFLFGTRLTRITRDLARRNPDEVVALLGHEITDWSGGTRIGAALSTFNRHWAGRVSAHGSAVMIISDGWDRGEPAELSREMARLSRLSQRLIWLNPLLGTEGYKPLTQGIRAALPYIDDFVPANSLDSLEALAVLLNTLE